MSRKFSTMRGPLALTWYGPAISTRYPGSSSSSNLGIPPAPLPRLTHMTSYAADDGAERQSRASMHAQVAPREELPAGTPHDDVLAEHPGRNRSTIRKLCDKRYGVPILHEDRVVNHGHSSMLRSIKAARASRGPPSGTPRAPRLGPMTEPRAQSSFLRDARKSGRRRHSLK